MSNYLCIRNLKINYRTFDGARNVLDIEHIEVERGSIYGIVGESSAGKTVLALAIQGLLPMPPGEIESGEIWIDGENVLAKKAKDIASIRGSKTSMIFQDPMSALNPVFTVGFQMRKILLSQNKLSKKDADKEVLEMLKTVKLPDPERIMDKYPHELSGGQRQRVIIGMALLCGAELIIADEPTRNLDVTIQAGILKLLKELQQERNVTVLFIANNLGLVSVLCDRVGILKEGKIIEQNTARELLEHPREDYTRMLIEAVTPEHRRDRKERVDECNIVEVRDMKKYFPIKNEFMTQKGAYVKAVDNVSFDIKKGDILGIVGESGCGKSTLVNTLLMLHKPTEGNVLFDGKEIFGLSTGALRNARKDVQIVFQDPFWSLNPRWLVKDIIGEPLRVHKKLSVDEFLEEVGNLMEAVGLSRQDIYKYPHEFSGGQRQRIAIARALSVRPKLIVLDEPTSAIDAISQSQILEILDELKEQLSLTYIIISHDLGVVNYMSDKIMVMYLGKIVEYGDAADVFDHPKHPYTVALFHAIPNIRTRSIEELAVVRGEVSSAIDPPKGCRFHPRCEKQMDVCSQLEPEVHLVNGVQVACHLYSK